MKISGKYKVREMAGQHVVIIQGRNGEDMTRIISLNGTSLFLWNELKDRDFDVEDVKSALMSEYGIDDARVNLAAGYVIEHLPHAGAVDQAGLHLVPDTGGRKRLAGIAAGWHAFGLAYGDALHGYEIGNGGGSLVPPGDDQRQAVTHKVRAAGGVDHLALSGLVHGFLIGGGKDVHGRAFQHLLEQRIGGGKVQMHFGSGGRFFKFGGHFLEGIGQTGGCGNKDFRGPGAQGRKTEAEGQQRGRKRTQQ